jgi:pectinesterase
MECEVISDGRRWFYQFLLGIDIYDTVDYVFGNIIVVFLNCTLHNQLQMANHSNIVTLQGRTDRSRTRAPPCRAAPTVATLDLTGNTTFGMTNYLGGSWKLYSHIVIIGPDHCQLLQ